MNRIKELAIINFHHFWAYGWIAIAVTFLVVDAFTMGAQ